MSVNIPMWRSDIRDAKATRSARIDSRMTTIAAELHRYEDLVTAVQALAESDGGRIDFNSYQAFAAHLLRGREGIQALNYTPRVASSEREAFEATARREGVADFHMTEVGPDGRPIPAGVRDEYFPIYDMYPLKGNEIALGLDGMSHSEALFERARDSGEIAASVPLRLVGQEEDWGVLIVGPVYSTLDTTTVEQRRTRLEGYAIGVFRVGEVFESILRNSAKVRGYDHYIFDGPPDRLGQLLYVHGSRLRRFGDSPPPFARIRIADAYVNSLTFGNRAWTVVTVPRVTGLPLPALDVSISTILGLIATGIGTFYVWSTRRRAAALRRLTTELRESEERLRTIFSSVSEGVFVSEPSTGTFIEVNQSAGDMFGYRRDEMIGRTIAEFSSGAPGYTQAAAIGRMGSLSNRPRLFEWQCKAKDGHFFWAEVVARRVSYGSKPVMLATLRDVTERRQIQERLTELARLDGLTGLPNRGVFVEALYQAVARARRSRQVFAVLYLDLDHFKDINDTLGHPVGDLFLKAVGDRLRTHVREIDTVARFGGDEFAVLATDLQEATDAGVLALKLLRALQEPFLIGGNAIRSGSSIGIALFDADLPAPEALLSHADLALYRAKLDGRGTYRFFTDSMDAEVRARVTLAEELRMAIEAESLSLVYQPQVEVESGRIVGVEALVRWRHPTRGTLMPTDFVAAAEKSGLIVPLGRWILREACRQAKAWLDDGVAPIIFGVNVSAIQLKSPLEVEAAVASALADTGLPAQYLELELTETALMEASQAHNDVLRRIHDRGIRLAIDDFGTGYSSLDYLRRYPVDRIKIAQTFVADITSDMGDAAIVKATIGLARELNINVIAEGVESLEQQELLVQWGCREVQGFYYARPMSSGDIAPLLRAGRIVPGREPAIMQA